MPLMVVQYVVISIRFEHRVLVVVMESMVLRATTFLCNSGAYTTLLYLISFQKGKRRVRVLVESAFMMHPAII